MLKFPDAHVASENFEWSGVWEKLSKRLFGFIDAHAASSRSVSIADFVGAV